MAFFFLENISTIMRTLRFPYNIFNLFIIFMSSRLLIFSSIIKKSVLSLRLILPHNKPHLQNLLLSIIFYIIYSFNFFITTQYVRECILIDWTAGATRLYSRIYLIPFSHREVFLYLMYHRRVEKENKEDFVSCFNLHTYYLCRSFPIIREDFAMLSFLFNIFESK